MQVYRFRDTVAVNLENGTIYLSVAEAEQIAAAINKVKRDVKQTPFTASSAGTIQITKGRK